MDARPKVLFLVMIGASASATAHSEQFDWNPCEVPGACSKVELGDPDQTTITREDGGHRVAVTITVAPKPNGWPDGFLVGDWNPLVPPGGHMIVTSVDIRVDGCRIEQPWPGLGGMSMPYAAILSSAPGRWQLEIYGGGDSSAYNVTHTFDTQRVLARHVGWGALYADEAHYDIHVDQELFADECLVDRASHSVDR